MARILVLTALAFAISGWAAEEKPMLFSPVSEEPEWRLLDPGQGRFTRQEFENRLGKIFDPTGAMQPYLLFDDGGVTLFRDKARTRPLYRLTFVPEGGAGEVNPPLLGGGDPARPLAGKVICLDPGHIGGDWADIEERTFRIGADCGEREGSLLASA